MNRLLFVVVLIVVGLLVASRLAREPKRPAVPDLVVEPATPAVAPPVAPPVAPIPGVAPTTPPPSAGSGGTPIIARLARLEARRRLSLAGTATYLDSLFVGGDSTLRRWDDGSVVRVAIVVPEGGTPPVDVVRSGLRFWERLGLGISFVDVADTTAADIVVEWIDRFDVEPGAEGQPGRTGLTAIRADDRGLILSARITLARSDSKGAALGVDAVRGIATHEFGHALGLPHSGRRDDIMYPTIVASQPSNRDRATASLLYSIPPGSLREPPSP